MKKLLIPLLVIVLVETVPVAPVQAGEAPPFPGCYPQYENLWVTPPTVCG